MWSVIVLVAIVVVGYLGYLPAMNRLGDRTTAFNLAALFAVLVASGLHNVLEALQGDWHLPAYNPPIDSQALRQMLGLFAMVQGFEASRYIGARFGAEERISTMHLAQVISTAVFVALIAFVLLPFGQFEPPADATAIFAVSEEVASYLPWLIMLAAIGSQVSAITNATSSRSDLLMEATGQAVPRRLTFPILLVPAIVVVLFTNVTEAVAIASRVFAVYFALQAALALMLAIRGRSWSAAAGITAVGVLMLAIAIFGLPI